MVSLLYMQNLTSRSTYKETVSTVSSKGQVTLPVEVRRHLGIDVNDRVAFVIETSGEVRVTQVKYPDIASLRGVAGSLKTSPPSFKEMIREAREDRITKKYGK